MAEKIPYPFDYEVFANLMHELDSARLEIRKTISELNEAIVGRTADVPRIRTKLPLLIEQVDALDVLFEFLRFELNPELFVYTMRKEINIHGIFHRAFRHFKHRLQAKELNYKIDRVEGFIVTAAPSLSIVPLVLIDNAIKYSPRGDQLSVSLNLTDRIATIHSHGPRIEKDELETIFQKSKRGRNAGQVVPAGQGLGLFIAKRICDAQGFKISAKVDDRTFKIAGVPYSAVSFELEFAE
jgi:signal transduction histidine kinase